MAIDGPWSVAAITVSLESGKSEKRSGAVLLAIDWRLEYFDRNSEIFYLTTGPCTH
jgi:hypothetical protein